MKIGIDAHHLGDRRTGNETYVYNLVKHLNMLEPNGEKYVVYLARHLNGQSFKHNLCFETKPIPLSISYLRFGLFYPLESWHKSFDVFHTQFTVPPFLRARSVVTVHDLAFERFPQFFPRSPRHQMQIMVPWSCRRADHVIAVSESTRRDVIELYRIDPKRVTVTYEAPSENYKPLPRGLAAGQMKEKYGIADPFILYVGNLEPRKNLPRLLQAFAHLKRKDSMPHKLVIVGQKGWFYKGIFETVRTKSLATEVLLTDYVPSADLPLFYNAASVMVYPSIFEGFGLPVIEAMACGTPVITSYGSSLEEIASGAAVLVDPYSVSSIASALEKVANSTELQQSLRQAGLARAAQFSFRRMAEQTRAVYHQL